MGQVVRAGVHAASAVWFVVVALLAAALVLPTSAQRNTGEGAADRRRAHPTVGVRAAAPTRVGLVHRGGGRAHR